MKSKAELSYEARRILSECIARFPEYQILRKVKIEISGRMTRCAGKAFYFENLVKLSLPFFADEKNFRESFRNTMTHELAHLIVGPFTYENGRRRPHGAAWRQVHRKLGGSGERCHTMLLADGFAPAARKKDVFELPCSCGCGMIMQLGKTQYKRQMNNHTRYFVKGHSKNV